MMNYDKIPVQRMVGAMRRYLEHGLVPGHFLTAVLSNDLMEAAGRADDENRAALFDWVKWLYNEAPRGSFGSPEAVKAWLEYRQHAAHARELDASYDQIRGGTEAE